MDFYAYTRKFFLAGIVLFTLSCSENETTEFSYQNYVDFKSHDIQYMQYYIPSELLFFSDVTVLSGASDLTVRIQFNHTFPEDAELEYFLDGNWKLLPNGLFEFLLVKGDPAIVQTRILLRIKSSGRVIAEEALQINFYPKEFYAQSNYNAPGYLIVQKDDGHEIPYIRYPLSYWNSIVPSDQDIAFAKLEWGALLGQTDDRFEKARILQKAIIDKLNPYQGIPSTELENMKPFDQYRTLVQGKDRLWCGNWAGIYSYALACFGYTVRQVALGAVLDDSQEPAILIAEGHRTMEVFDGYSNRWKVIDLTFYMIEARYENQPLNILDLHYMINNPQYLDRIRLLEYIPESHKEIWIPLIDSKNADKYFNYYKLNQNFKFLKAG